MAGDDANDIELRPWSADDLDLMTRLLGDPAMTEHLGGPETPEAAPETARSVSRDDAVRRPDVRDRARRPIAFPPARSATGPTSRARWRPAGACCPRSRGEDAATRGTARCLDLAAADGGYETIHAYPSVENVASNALSRTLGFALLRQADFEYPKGHWMTCNDWSLDLVARSEALRALA